MDLLTAALQIGFYVLFGVSVWQYARHRGPLELSVMAIFASIAGLFVLSAVNALRPDLTAVARPVLLALLFAHPYLVVRLLDQIRPVPRIVSRVVLAGAVVAWAVLLLGLGPVPDLRAEALVFSVSFFFAAELWCAGRFGGDSRRRIGIARLRLASAAIATALIGSALLISGISSVIRGPGSTSDTVTTLTRFMVLIATLGYLGAFVPPVWFRRFVNRASSFGLIRRLVAPPMDGDVGSLWTDLASTAQEILGARRVTILSASPDLEPLAVVGDAEPAGRPTGVISTVELAIRPDRAETERLVAEIDGRPLFVGDDVLLLEGLSALTAEAADREELVVGLIESRREAEEAQAVRASETRFRALLEAAPDAILALGEDGRVAWATRQAGELFGTQADQLSGIPLSDLVVLVKDEIPTTGPDDRPVFRSETTGRRLDGTHFPAEVARSDFELDGRPFQVAVVSDVTWRHEADQIRDRFLGVLSHELRTPVTSIYGGTQLLLGRGARLDEETRNELLVSVAGEAERLQRMIENLVAMARIERGAEFGGSRPVLLDRIIRQLVDREKALWPEVTIKLVSAGPVQMVAADEEYLAQIMRNLLSNAAKYSGPGSTVEVSLEDGEDEVLIRVCDNGPGIAADDADRLFALYYRAARQAAVAPGAGIGLFVCRELVATMGGRIWARPRPEGGAEFGFSLPTYVDEWDVVPAAGGSPAAANGTGPANGTASTNGSGAREGQPLDTMEPVGSDAQPRPPAPAAA